MKSAHIKDNSVLPLDSTTIKPQYRINHQKWYLIRYSISPHARSFICYRMKRQLLAFDSLLLFSFSRVFVGGVEQSIIEHIDKFSKYKSHYCRAQTDRMYLPPDMTLSKMYDLYLLEANTDESRKTGSFASYKIIFYTKLNLQKKKPQKDTCNKCDLLAVKIRDTTLQETKLNLEKERDQHHREAEDARALKKQDLTSAKTCDYIETLTFDMEKTLPLPRIPTNIAFYKRQLWLYNCGVHSGKTGRGFCYMWVEGIAGRGAQEVGSTLRKHITLNLDSKVKELIL